MSAGTIKFTLVRIIRIAGLLWAADACKFWLGRLRSAARNRRFEREFPQFATPPRHLAFDALNHVDWPAYRESGERHAALFARVLRSVLGDQSALDVLEWGCGPGRLIRHMPALLAGQTVRCTGSDYNPESIAWCRAHLPDITFAENALNPPLPFASASFDAVYNFSVFTHLSEAVQLAWAAELRRVLRPGGLLICTTHGEAYRYLLSSAEEQQRYAAGLPVEQGNYAEGRKWFFAIHPEAFVRGHLLAGYEAVQRVPVRPEDGVLQDVWTARKPRVG